MMDVSILIVHYNTPGLLRQTLKAIRRAAPTVSYEVIVVDNNPSSRVYEKIAQEFHEVKIIVGENIGFGRGMNLAMKQAQGRYQLIYNPDIMLAPGALESMVAYMDAHSEIGILGPRLNNPDGTLQHSCYRFMRPRTILYRRLPFLRVFKKAKDDVREYLMADADHTQTQPVDYILGAAMFVRKEALDQVGGFDPGFFMYFEDQDLCRRFWEHGWKVIYYPEVSFIHYHRRETADGRFLKQLLNPLTRIQIESALYYYKKYKNKDYPRLP